MKMRRLRLFISYFFILFVIVVYVASNTYHYKFSLQQQDMETEISDLKGQINDIEMKINTTNSRTNVTKKYPDLTINDNVYYLENNG